MIVKMYLGDANGHLKDLREQANQWRTMKGISPKTRDALIKHVVLQENLEKYRLVQLYKAFGVKP
jgi:hypothetical protein